MGLVMGLAGSWNGFRWAPGGLCYGFSMALGGSKVSIRYVIVAENLKKKGGF
jgi:hypothetical protein